MKFNITYALLLLISYGVVQGADQDHKKWQQFFSKQQEEIYRQQQQGQGTPSAPELSQREIAAAKTMNSVRQSSTSATRPPSYNPVVLNFPGNNLRQQLQHGRDQRHQLRQTEDEYQQQLAQALEASKQQQGQPQEQKQVAAATAASSASQGQAVHYVLPPLPKHLSQFTRLEGQLDGLFDPTAIQIAGDAALAGKLQRQQQELLPIETSHLPQTITVAEEVNQDKNNTQPSLTDRIAQCPSWVPIIMYAAAYAKKDRPVMAKSIFGVALGIQGIQLSRAAIRYWNHNLTTQQRRAILATLGLTAAASFGAYKIFRKK